MRRYIFTVVYLSVFVFMPFLNAHAGQIIKNGGFEEGLLNSDTPRDWKNLSELGINEADSLAGYAWDDTTAHSGNRSIKIQKANDDNIAGWSQQIFSLQPGKWYELSAWIKTQSMNPTPIPETGAIMGLVFVIKGVDRLVIYNAPLIKQSPDWQEQKLVFSVPEDCSEVRLVLGLKGIKGTVWWDDIFIKNAPDLALSVKQEDNRSEIDRYGGYKKIRGKATGFFHTEIIGNRWWIITPEGNGFIVSGIQHMLRPDRPTQKWIEDSTKRLKEWGFNTLSHNSVFKPFVYTQAASPSLWGFPIINPSDKVKQILVPLVGIDSGNIYSTAVGFFDVFDKSFEAILEREFSEKAAVLKNDPWLLGYFLGNELPWDGYPAARVTLFDMFFALSGDRPGKKAAVDFLKNRYQNNIGNFNQAWGTGINNFEELLSMNALRAQSGGNQPQSDVSEFIRLVAGKYFKTNYEVIKKYDRMHLILGVRFSQHARTPTEVLEESSKFVDIETFNAYDLIAPLESLDKTYQYHRRPVLITEFSAKAQDSGMPNKVGAGIIFRSQRDRAVWYEKFVLRLLSWPNAVGFIWYKYEDDPLREIGEDGNYGLVTRDEKVYTELVETVKRINRRVYQYVTQGI